MIEKGANVEIKAPPSGAELSSVPKTGCKKHGCTNRASGGAMKKLIALLIALCLIGSCKKTQTITQRDLVGKWNELQPCRGTSNCISIQFNADSTYYRSFSAVVDSGLYIMNGPKLLLYRIGYTPRPQDGANLVIHSTTNITMQNAVVCYGCSITGDDTYSDLNLQKQ